MKYTKIVLLVLAFVLAGCTSNQMVRKWGGTETKTLPAGTKLVNVTWKDSDLWILTRAMREDEKPESYSFSESSSLGIMEGTVIIVEQGSAPKPTPKVSATPFINATVKP